jgi:hypothetical protein
MPTPPSIVPGQQPIARASTPNEQQAAASSARPFGPTPRAEAAAGPPRRATGEGAAAGPPAPRASVPVADARAARRGDTALEIHEEDAIASGDIATPERAGSTATPERLLLARGERSESGSWRFTELSASNRREAPEHAVIDIPEQTPHEVVASALRDRPFEADALPTGEQKDSELARQHDMEREYIDAMATALQARRSAFGGEGLYQLGEDMKAPYQDAVLPAVYEATRQFISSGSRSPARNALIAKIGPRSGPGGRSVGELAFQMDAASISGAVAGVPAYLTDAWVLQALSRRAKLANFPEMKAVDVKTLVPDPSPVQLRLVGPGKAKAYWRPVEHGPARGAERDLPTMTELRNEAASRREAIARWQKRLDGQGLFRWFQPGMSGAFNVARRALSSTRALIEPLPVFVTSLAASSSAGAASKFALTMAKATPGLSQVDVDDLVGGRQKLNLFAVKAPDAQRPAARWADIRRLPQFVGEVAQEAASLAVTSLRPSVGDRFAQAVDILRTSLANATASVASQAVGPLLGSILRGGSASPLAGESLRSGAFLLQQFGQSTINDYEWNSSKDYTKSDAHDLAGELDRARDSKQHALMRGADRTHTQVLAGIHALREGAPLADDIASALGQIQAILQQEGAVDVGRLFAAKATLERATAQDGLPVATAAGCGDILAGIDASIRLADQHELLARWRRPADAAPDHDDRRR